MRQGRLPRATGRVWRAGLLGALALGVACAPAAQAPAAAPAPSVGATPTTVSVERLRVAYASTGLTQAYTWVAQDAGYFREEGLDVDLQYVPGSNVASQALLAGEVQFLAGGGSTAIGAALGGADTVILATMVGTFVISIMGLPEVAPTAEGVRGSTMAVTRIGSTSDFVARYWLRRVGVEPVIEIPIVQTGGNAEQAAALVSGAAQMVSVTDLFGLELQRQGFRELADTGELGAEYIYSGVTTTRGYQTAHDDVARRYVRAAVRGQGRFVADRALGVELVGKYSKLDDADVLGRAWERHTTKYIKRIPYTTPAAVQMALDELALTNDRARAADPEQFYDNRYVRELDDAGVFATLYPPPHPRP
jgi:NitT/TauT family transport system substrate-binding protein